MLAAANLSAVTPLFSSVVVFMNYPKASLNSSGLEITAASYDEHSHYSIAVLVEPGEQLKLMLIHDETEISSHMGDFLLQQLALNLTALAANSQLSIGEFLRLTRDRPDKQKAIELVEPVVDVVSALIESAQRYPGRFALSVSGQSLSYAELVGVVRVFAHELREMGVEAGSNVVIVLPRSQSALVAIWATLWIRAAYVPLAMSLPSTRIEEVVAACDAKLLITEGDRLDVYARQLCLDAAEVVSGDDFTGPNLSCPDDTAYQIHTSGSTGKAKRVPVTAGSSLTLLRQDCSSMALRRIGLRCSHHWLLTVPSPASTGVLQRAVNWCWCRNRWRKIQWSLQSTL